MNYMVWYCSVKDQVLKIEHQSIKTYLFILMNEKNSNNVHKIQNPILPFSAHLY